MVYARPREQSSIVIMPYAYGDIKAAISILFVHCAPGISIKNGRTITSELFFRRLSYHYVWFGRAATFGALRIAPHKKAYFSTR